MTWRRIALYYILGTVLGGYFFLFEWQPDSERPIHRARPIAQSRLLPIPRDEIREVSLRRAVLVVSFRRNGQQWQVIEPDGAQVTSALVTSFVENLTPEKELQVIDEAPGDLSPYGLDHPSSTVIIKGDHTVTTIFIGSTNPTSSAVYARKEHSPQVVLLGHSVRYYGDLIFQAARSGKQ